MKPRTDIDACSVQPLWLTVGTLVATIRGEMPVEEVQPVLRVLTRAAGLVRVRAVGTATTRARGGPSAMVMPAGALGQGLPERALTMIGDQRVFVFGDMAGEGGDRFCEAAELGLAPAPVDVAVVRLELAAAGPLAILANGVWLGASGTPDETTGPDAEAHAAA